MMMLLKKWIVVSKTLTSAKKQLKEPALFRRTFINVKLLHDVITIVRTMLRDREVVSIDTTLDGIITSHMGRTGDEL